MPPVTGSGTGAAPDADSAASDQMKLRMLELEKENESLKNEVHTLTVELQNLRISEVEPEPQVDVTEEAARKRLERICKRNSQGRLGLYRWCWPFKTKYMNKQMNKIYVNLTVPVVPWSFQRDFSHKFLCRCFFFKDLTPKFQRPSPLLAKAPSSPCSNPWCLEERWRIEGILSEDAGGSQLEQGDLWVI